MNKSAIRKFAIDARNELINKVSQKANEYGIEKDNILEVFGNIINGIALEDRELNQRKALVNQINAKSYDEVMEEIAYTWFNRFIALRFMEVNGYLPSRIKVFTNENNEFKPEILQEALHLSFDNINREKIIELKESNKDEELFKYLLIAQCNDLNKILPAMFQNISDYTELLFPDNLLRTDSIIDRMIKDIPEEDFRDQVQIIGWLYQYYNTEPKDRVFKELKKRKKITREKIPAATQLFTPDWIVRYMVENSLGRLWVEGHPNEEIKSNWKYYLEEVKQKENVQAELDKIKDKYSKINPTDIKCMDPSMGSGHILVYMFDVLMQIYESTGFTKRDAVENIIKYNLYGLDIDERAYQLSYFSIMMKARQYDRRFFNKDNIVQPNIYAISQSNELLENHSFIEQVVDNSPYKKDINSVLNDMKDAEEYGSIININKVDFEGIKDYITNNLNNQINIFTDEIDKLLKLVKIAETLHQKYEVVVTNPPYMGSRGMGPKLSNFVKKHYKDSKSDLFAVFMERCSEFTRKFGFLSMITQHNWMFLSSYENLRNEIINRDIVNMLHLGTRAFEEIGGEVVQTTTFIQSNSKISDRKTKFIRLTGINDANEKELETLKIINNNTNDKNVFISNLDEFDSIPGSPIAYWADKAVFEAYKKGKLIDDLLDVKQGLSTANNNRFLRFWWEVDINKCKFDTINKIDLLESGKKWVPCNKGGKRRQWYGNYDYLVNWENDGFEIKNFVDGRGKQKSVVRNPDYYFKEAITWGLITSGGFNIRYRTHGGIHEMSGMSAFSSNEKRLKEILGVLSTPIADYIFKILNPTINLSAGPFQNFPIIDFNEENKERMIDLVDENIDIAKNDWDSYEDSWDFRSHFLVNTTDKIRESFDIWNKENHGRFERLKNNEEMIDKIVIDAYGLNEVVPYEISDEDITLNKANLTLDIKSLISYFIGCYMGRYSLDQEGLVFAGGDFDPSKYTTFKADDNGIIPIIDNEYFDDDVVTKFIDFIKIVYGEETLEENLQFIADALGGTGTARDIIRQYFIKDFYKDHLKTYQKRPIYWLFDSGKKNAFKALVYMHRYQKDTIAKIRTEYIHEYQDKYAETIKSIESSIETASTSDKVKLNKELKDLKDKAEELRLYEEKIHHLADQMIEIDLDDGVEHNYELFKDVLAKRK